MCELMAMSFAEPVSAGFSLRAFAARGEANPDGWGLAWYPDGGRAVAVAKEPIRWDRSRTAGFLADHPTLSSRVYLAHVREKTVGGAPNHADTHPFHREQGGTDYALAHNGTLSGAAWNLPLGRHRPVGATDSERFFCHLLHELGEVAAARPALASPDDWAWLHAQLAAANAFGKLNVLFSDGERLFVHHDANGWKGLSFRRLVVRDGRPRHFEDDDLGVDLAAPEDGSPRPNPGFIVSTYPMSETGWHRFHIGELIVFERGRIAWSSHRPADAPEFAPAGAALAGA